MQGLKNAILAILQIGPCTGSLALKNPSQNSKIIYALGADGFLAMLEVKIREAPFFKVQSGKIQCGWSPIPKFFSEKKNGKQNFEMFKEVVHNFGKSEGDIIQ